MAARLVLHAVALLLFFSDVQGQHGKAVPALGSSCSAYAYNDALDAIPVDIQARLLRTRT